MVNLTVNLFGESLNLLEVGARAEGFENMIEDFFGPDGYFRYIENADHVSWFDKIHTFLYIEIVRLC